MQCVPPPPTVFVTSSTHTGDLVTEAGTIGYIGTDGLEAGDHICQVRADEAGLPGNWKAWLSKQGADASANDRINATTAPGPYLLPNGTVVANTWDDLIDSFNNPLLAPINITEENNVTASSVVWTSTGTNGNSYQADHCDGWTSAVTVRPSQLPKGRWGDPTSVNSLWTARGPQKDCDTEAALYCFKTDDL